MTTTLSGGATGGHWYYFNSTLDTTGQLTSITWELVEPTPPEQPDGGDTLPDESNDPVPEPAPDPEEE